jgi:hypothetical protein
MSDNINNNTVSILAKELTRMLMNTKILLPSSWLAFFSISETGSLKKTIKLVIIKVKANMTHSSGTMSSQSKWLS